MTATPRQRRKKLAHTCPNCGTAMVRIIYGEPSRELEESAELGAVVLGGCVRSEDEPRWHCRCGHEE